MQKNGFNDILSSISSFCKQVEEGMLHWEALHRLSLPLPHYLLLYKDFI